MKKKSKKQNKVFNIIFIVISALATAALLYLCIRIALSQIFPPKIMVAIYIITWILVSLFIFVAFFKKIKKWAKITTLVLEILIIVTSIFGIYYIEKSFSFIDSISSKSENTEQVADISNTPFFIYVSGIDTYGEISNVSRSDVNIVVAINPKTEQIFILDIPRDYYVELYGTGTKDKLSHSGLLGVENTVKTVSAYLGIDINYYIRLNFDSMKNLVNLIGGIEVEAPKAFTANADRNCHFKEGKNYVTGTCALAFARERKSFATGDQQRAEDQGHVLTRILEKITEPKFFASNYLSILDAAKDNLETNMSSSNIAKLINFELDKTPSWKIEQYTLKETTSFNYGYMYPNELLWMGVPVQETVDTAKAKISEIMSY